MGNVTMGTSARASGNEELFANWEADFRNAAKSDDCRHLLRYLEACGLTSTPKAVMEATVAVVAACCAFRVLDGQAIAEFLAHQRYGAAASPQAHYRLHFELTRVDIGVVVVGADLRWIDLADLYGAPWQELQRVGYSGFWVARMDGAALAESEVEALESAIRSDLRFDYGEDEVRFDVDPDSQPGCLYCAVYDHDGTTDE